MTMPSNPGTPGSNEIPLPPKKKTNVLLWILGGLLVVMASVTAMCGIGGYLLFQKAKQSGFDTELMQKNPAYAAAKMAVTLNPEYETVSSDDSAGTITMREKKTGKTMTWKFDPDKKTMVVTDEEGKEATFSATGDPEKGGGVTMQTPEGKMTIGGGGTATLPSWLPQYPGATAPQSTISAQGNDGMTSGFTFTTPDAPSKVYDFFKGELESGGFQIKMSATTPDGTLLMAAHDSTKRSVTVRAGAPKDGTTEVSVMAVEGK